ncbi:MAG: TfoX/Sxy family protein [Chitinophagaceae bacterium]|nr:TfoX/Sxy family protein [Chitinophagaceae bacterium]
MAYNEKLADRIREIIAATHKNVEEKKMFAGLCFMVNDKMCVGVHEDRIMVRLDPAVFDKVIEKEGCEPMNFTGKIMRGFVFVGEDVLKTKKQLDYWVQLGLEFNKIAKSSKKPAKKAAKQTRPVNRKK